jgi:hypothetical protein
MVRALTLPEALERIERLEAEVAHLRRLQTPWSQDQADALARKLLPDAEWYPAYRKHPGISTSQGVYRQWFVKVCTAPDQDGGSREQLAAACNSFWARVVALVDESPCTTEEFRRTAAAWFEPRRETEPRDWRFIRNAAGQIIDQVAL